MTSEIGSFAQKTILHRKLGIIDKVIAENNYPAPIIKRLASFKKEILGNNVRPLTEQASDVEAWNDMVQRFEHNTWLELPWYWRVAEVYFYRRLLEAVEYFKSGSTCGCDPFQQSKKSLSGLRKCMQMALSGKTFEASADWFWASLYHFCEMPKDLYEELSRLDMVIL